MTRAVLTGLIDPKAKKTINPNAWTPMTSSLTPYFWFEPRRETSYSDTDPITTLEDLTGNGYDLSAAGSGDDVEWINAGTGKAYAFSPSSEGKHLTNDTFPGFGTSPFSFIAVGSVSTPEWLIGVGETDCDRTVGFASDRVVIWCSDLLHDEYSASLPAMLYEYDGSDFFVYELTSSGAVLIDSDSRSLDISPEIFVFKLISFDYFANARFYGAAAFQGVFDSTERDLAAIYFSSLT